MTATGTLYLVPNTLDFGMAAQIDLQEVVPLGAIRIAARLAHWVAENAKTTRAFLKRVDAVEPLKTALQLQSIVVLPRPPKGGQASGEADLKLLLTPLLQGHDVGLISEAGMPAIADPGAALVQAAHTAQIRVSALPGPNSLMLALAASGLNGQSFAFVGYLPIAAPERAVRIKELEAQSRRQQQTQLVIETPYRNEAFLGALLQHLGTATWLSVSCGLTLDTAWTRTDRVGDWRRSIATMPNDIPAVFSFLGAPL
jgi:16S rRNA (cytidine1402-2'-O)-methyltransferase